MASKNHLQDQTSPYLLQHAGNPVNWYPWGEEALTKARKEQKPLLVSIGYSACHWCHVMEKESFEDEEVAQLMNRFFVCVKVDREERPDIDHLYMNAVQLVSGRGGWPLNCFVLPDGRPFWGGTYFPREQWLEILGRVAELFHDQYGDVEQQAENITKGLADSAFVPVKEQKAVFDREDAAKIYRDVIGIMDAAEGGTKGAPKFPLPVNQLFLLHYYQQTGEEKALKQVQLGLRKMALGGIYDQVGGGFARYATDGAWKIPHFEKMLYDNGQLMSLYAAAWKTDPDPLFREVVYDTAAFTERELTSPEGTFYSALDADSEGEEGKFYVWTEPEIDEALGEDAPLIREYFQVGGKGLWEGDKNILLRVPDDEAFAREKEMDVKALRKLVARSRKKLLEVRSHRVRPGLDDKVLVAWNALMIEGLADASAAFGEERFLQQARRAADFILNHALQEDGRLYRSLRGSEASIDGFLEDYALLSKALLRLYEVSMHLPYLETARMLTEHALEHFAAEGTHLLAFSSKKSEQLASPFYEFFDNVMPASNSVMGRVLFYLANYYEKPEWGQRSSRMLQDMMDLLRSHGHSMTNWGVLLLHHTAPFHTIVITGEQATEKSEKFLQRFLPDALLAARKSDGPGLPPVFAERFVPGKTMIYICGMGYCKAPVEDVKAAFKQMKA